MFVVSSSSFSPLPPSFLERMKEATSCGHSKEKRRRNSKSFEGEEKKLLHFFAEIFVGHFFSFLSTTAYNYTFLMRINVNVNVE